MVAISYNKNDIYKILSAVPDPEIPVLTIEDLGILRDVKIQDKSIEVIITPTYSGCPAMDMITVNIMSSMQNAGYDDVKVKLVLAPAWTTDWMTEEGKSKLKDYGIAPPVEKTTDKNFLFGEPKIIPCPQCDSKATELLSQFGSTACKALYRCKECKEPFDYFKCH